jgi:hypothetical protein
MKRKHLIFMLSLVFAVTLWSIQKYLMKAKKSSDVIVQSILKEQDRFPTAIPTDNNLPISSKEKPIKNLKNFESRLLKELSMGHSVKFDEIEERKITKKGKTKSYSFVKVEITSPEGVKSYFNAQVDSQTGSMVQSWNKTRHEMKKSPLLTHPDAQ